MAEVDYFGIIRPLKPRAQKFWGTRRQIAAHVGIDFDTSANLLFEGKSYFAWRRMTEEEAEKYYQPRKFTPARNRKVSFKTLGDLSKYWIITIARNWNGTPKDWAQNFKGKRRSHPFMKKNVYEGTIDNVAELLGIDREEVLFRVYEFENGLEPYRAGRMKKFLIKAIHKPDKKPPVGHERYLRAAAKARAGVKNLGKDLRDKSLRAKRGEANWDKRK